MNNLDRLRELTVGLPEFPDYIGEKNNFTEYKMTRGKCFGWNLFRVTDISVDRWYNSQGTVFPMHAHKTKEWIIVYEGMMFLYECENGDDHTLHKLERGDSWYLKQETLHRAEFPQDCAYMTVTIPAAVEFPKPKGHHAE